MANENPNILILLFGIGAMILTRTDCRPVNTPGTVTRTGVSNFVFFQRIANPCEISTAQVSHQSTPSTTTTGPATPKSQLELYESLVTALDLTISKLQILESADPSLPECNGISLDSLPSTPTLDNMNEADAVKQAYKTGIYLTTHFHLMELDRQLTTTGNNNIPDEQLEDADDLPSWRFLRCGNESESFPNDLQDVTLQMENVLCVILTSATDEQRASFREPFNTLRRTTLYRYHTSCSTLQTRDCLVVREAKQALSLIRRKFSQLVSVAERNRSQSSTEDEMENTL